MKEREDLTGRRFNRWTVLGNPHKNERRFMMWDCICDCGTVREISESKLRSGAQKSCGCLLREYLDISGHRYGRLTAIKLSHKKGRRYFWDCMCDCGNEVVVPLGDLRCGHTKSCGCYKKDVTSKVKSTHKKHGTRIYQCWNHMNQRCSNPNDSAYKDYGGRGIVVCDRWQSSFENFYKDMGEPPTDCHQIDRIDNNGNYEPLNCRWVTPTENSRNKRSNRLITYNEKTMCLSEWAQETGISEGTISKRLKLNWSKKFALTIPVGAPRGLYYNTRFSEKRVQKCQ